MGKRLLLAVNPKAGKSEIRHRLLGIIEHLAESGYETVVLASRGPGEITETVARTACNYDLIICCGGDGTLHETVNGIRMSGCDVPLGYLPTGTVNDFASTHSLSKDLSTAIRDVTAGKPCGCDLGSFNGRYFTYVAAFGAFSEVSYETPQKSKAALGRLAYIFEGAKRLPELKPVHITVKTDSLFFEDEVIYGMISNSVSIGGFNFFPKDNVKTDDGVLEATFVKNPKNFGETQEAAIALLQGAQSSPMIYRMQIKKAVLSCEVPIRWSLDGEYGGAVETATICAVHNGIRIVK